jgi:CheY-like chemotaxis protein/HPt (histidine-containing phosphotransfer) domain-containing protein
VTATLPAPPGPRRVLLVDDDDVSIELLALLLDHDGHEVMRASSGQAALHLLQNGGADAFPDVLLIDMQMPGLSGREVAGQVRALHGANPLLLAMSATEVGREELSGFDGFLLKPLALEDLRRALKLNKRSRRRASGGDRARRPGGEQAIDPIDENVARKLRMAMPPAALQELYEACIADTRSRAESLRTQVLAGDLTGVPRGGHQIKGAASMVGFARIAKLALSLELGSCKEEDTLRLLDDLLSSCEELERILQAGKLQKAP